MLFESRGVQIRLKVNSCGEITSQVQVPMDTGLYAMSLFGKKSIYPGYVIFGLRV